ncbi:hypothetical protein F4780DRAFT_377132 [Xylariomycetidae sp. FL0641]|nr:hypothetical protein F4780DRAFT_377132 [Xylariomycetidae sp. FL0641]
MALLASLLPALLFAQSTLAQTIEVGGQAVAAEQSNLGPAYAAVDDLDEPSSYQLTDDVIANLTSMKLSNVSLFEFGDMSETPGSFQCKVMPGDAEWPSEDVWNALYLLTDGNLIKTVPIGAVCFDGEHYNADTCDTVLTNWTSQYLHHEDPTSLMWPLASGAMCMPQNAANSSCEMGSFPPYSVKATSVYQVQLAVNFARNTGVRLAIRNTGHDYLGKSTGAGALSIWTHNIKGIEFIQNYSSSSTSYTGPAFKLGAGVQDFELYEAANEHGVTAFGGEGETVGVAGGYTLGGGHSPLSSKYGMAADQVLSIDLVTPDGKFLTADEANNTELFWALRGGGAGTFGVVTSMTVRVHPKMTFSGMTLSVSAGDGGDMDVETFWNGLSAYWELFPGFADAGSYAYSLLFTRSPNGYTWGVNPWLIPGMPLEEFKTLTQPLLDRWATLGFNATPAFFEHDNFYDTWTEEFQPDAVGQAYIRTVSRLFPAENWKNPSLLNQTVETIRGIVDQGSALVSYNTNGGKPDDTPDNAVMPAWRDAYMFAIVGAEWDAGTSDAEVEEINKNVETWADQLRSLTPGGGTYLNEADIMEPNFSESFYGYDNYIRLSTVKETYDPWGLLFAQTGVGSEKWYVEDQPDWLTRQTGRLCPVS